MTSRTDVSNKYSKKNNKNTNTNDNNDNNNDEYNDVLSEIQYYMLDEKNIDKSLENKLVSTKNDNKNKNMVSDKPKSNIFIPREKDSLFWCFYIIANGEMKYETLNNKNEVIAKQLKIEYIEKIRKEKKTIKIYKFDSISNIESNLVNENCINAKTFLTLCVLENKNVIYISKKTFFELKMNDSNEIYILYEIASERSKYNTKYGFELGTIESVQTIRDTLYQVEKIDKPIMGFSAYTIKQLLEICQKLAIETTNKDTNKLKSKKELYEGIIQYF